MPIWSLTLERLEKLKSQIAAKKAEHDELDALSEKDLWCNDLDEFVAEWEMQLRLDDEIQTGIRRMGRRASTKIGAGKGRKAKGDGDYQPGGKAKAAKAVAKVVPKAEPKAQQRFLEKFQARAKPKPTESTPIEIDLSDDDFALLGKKATVKKEIKEESQPPAPVADAAASRTKRAATAKSKYVIDTDDDSDEDFMALASCAQVGDGVGVCLGCRSEACEASGRVSPQVPLC
jgi:DNA topoisomerase II